MWVIKPEYAKVININFDDRFNIRKLPSCEDYLITSYPGISEPIVECGKDVSDKIVEADQVWIEFVTNEDEDVGSGFKLTYTSSDVIVRTTTPSPVRK